MTKFDYLGLRGKLYDMAGSLGVAGEENPENKFLENAYDFTIKALDEIEAFCIKEKYIDPDTLEVIEE